MIKLFDSNKTKMQPIIKPDETNCMNNLTNVNILNECVVRVAIDLDESFLRK